MKVGDIVKLIRSTDTNMPKAGLIIEIDDLEGMLDVTIMWETGEVETIADVFVEIAGEEDV